MPYVQLSITTQSSETRKYTYSIDTAAGPAALTPKEACIPYMVYMVQDECVHGLK